MSNYMSYILATTLLATPMAAYAQAPMEFEHIVVTAQKREQNLQDVSISLEVLQSSDLEKFHVSDLRNVTTLVPNFYFQPSPGNDALFIRGFGSPGANFGFEQSVSLYQDGIYAGRSRQFMAPFFDIERVEVLRGPQGALLGKNTAAGAVSIVTASPTKELTGNAKGVYNFLRDGYEVSGVVSGPLSDTFSARLAVKHKDYDGYMYNTATGEEDPQEESTIARLSLKFEPNEKMDFLGKVEYGKFKSIGDSGVHSAPDAPLPETRGDSNIFGFPLLDRQKSWNASLTANFYAGEHTITSVTGYSDFSSYRAVNAPHEPNSFFHNQYFEDFDQFSQEIRVLSPVGQKFEYIFGAYYDTANWNILAPTYFDIAALNTAGQLNIDFDQDAKTYSAFAAGTLNLTDYFRIKASMRYTHSKKHATYDQVQVSGNTHPAIGSPRSFEKAVSEKFWDPQVTLEWNTTDDVMLFANYARGSKGAGYVAAVRTINVDTFTVDGERSTNYELGLKSMWLDKRLTLNLTGFYTKFKDLQVSAYVPALATTITTNAASARAQGLEGSANLQVSRDFKLSSSFSYITTKYLDYPGAGCTALQPATCTPPTNNIAGYSLLSTPKWSGTVRAEYGTPINDSLKLETNLVSTFKTKYFNSTDYSPVYGVQKGHVKIDGRIQIGGINDEWSVALVGTNLTNKRTVPFSYFFPAIFSNTGNHIVRFVDEPRAISIEAGMKF